MLFRSNKLKKNLFNYKNLIIFLKLFIFKEIESFLIYFYEKWGVTVMISNLVFVGADDLVDDFKESHARGRLNTIL